MGLCRIECSTTVGRTDWDSLVAQLDGGFFHSHAYGMYEAARQRAMPLFIKAYDERGNCLGVMVGLTFSPRHWPLSSFCREVTFGALPATRGRVKTLEQQILKAVEGCLSDRGVFRLRVDSYDSPNAADVLSTLAYDLKSRCELYLELTGSTEEIWSGLRGKRRTDIRKATKSGVQTTIDNTLAGLKSLEGHQAESLFRRGVQQRRDDQAAVTTKALLLDAGVADVFVSRLDGTPINAALMSFFNGRAYYMKSGSSPVGFNHCGPAHLLWTAIEILKGRGCRVLNLGGTPVPGEADGSQDGLFRFKEAFNPIVVVQPSGSKILSQPGDLLDRVRSFLKRRRSAEEGLRHSMLPDHL